eukprot:1487461-Amphidinium_carterae.1
MHPPDMAQAPRWQQLAALQDQSQLAIPSVNRQTLIPHHCSPSEHLQAAAALQHPFHAEAQLPLDVRFAVQSHCQSFPQLLKWRQGQWDRFQAMLKELDPLRSLLHERVPPFLKPIVSEVHIPLLAVLVQLLAWPDWELPLRFILGFLIVGAVPA